MTLQTTKVILPDIKKRYLAQSLETKEIFKNSQYTTLLLMYYGYKRFQEVYLYCKWQYTLYNFGETQDQDDTETRQSGLVFYFVNNVKLEDTL